MQRTPVSLVKEDIPETIHPYLEGATVFDSSCSKIAQVWFLDKGAGFYLKKAPKDTLRKEAMMTGFYHSKAFGPEVICYESSDFDWLMTRRVPGEDCTWQVYKGDPQRLCDTTAQLLRMLHETPIAGCPIADRTADYLKTASHNYRIKAYDIDLFPDNWGYATPEEAWRVIEETGHLLKADTLLHGDYCLPNIMLDNWQFSGFIDLDTAGVGDKHVDLFWGMWSLQFNLKTDRYCQRFLDVYGRDGICEELFRTVAAVEVFG